MKRTRQEKLIEKLIDKRIEQAYYARCSGIQISVMDIGAVFKHGRKLIADGATDAALSDGVLEFVESIRK